MKKTRADFVMVPEDDPQWVRFWNAYPNRCSKKDARRAWAKLAPDLELVEQMLATLAWQIPLHRWDGEKAAFAPYPSSWLNGERWKDEPPLPAVRRALSEKVSDPMSAWLSQKALNS